MIFIFQKFPKFYNIFYQKSNWRVVLLFWHRTHIGKTKKEDLVHSNSECITFYIRFFVKQNFQRPRFFQIQIMEWTKELDSVEYGNSIGFD